MSGAICRSGKQLQFGGAVRECRESLGRGSDTRQRAHAEIERTADHGAIAVRRDDQASTGRVQPIYFRRREHRAGADQAIAVRARQQADRVERLRRIERHFDRAETLGDQRCAGFPAPAPA